MNYDFELAPKQVYLVEFLAEFGYITIDQAANIVGSTKTAYRHIQGLKQNKLILKTKQGTGRTAVTQNENPALRRQRLALMRVHKNMKKLSGYTKKADEDVKNLISEIKKDITIVAPDVLRYQENETVSEMNLYTLTEAGKRYSNDMLGVKPKSTNYHADFILRRIMQGNMACLLYGLGVEILQSRYEQNSFKAPLFVSSRAAKELKADIGSASRVLGILFTQRFAYALYRDQDRPRRFVLQDERSLRNTQVIPTMGVVDQCIFITDNRNSAAQLEQQLNEEIKYDPDQEGIKYHAIHIIENNKSGGNIFRLLVLNDNWIESILENVFEDQVIYESEVREADCKYMGKSVFVMITNDYARKAKLDALLLLSEKLNDVIIICMESQIDYYTDQIQFPGATVFTIADSVIESLSNV